MNKPNNFDKVSTGDFTPVAPGGHHMTILCVKEQKSQSGKDMLVVMIDFAPTDSQPLYFAKLYEDDIRPDKKWPRSGIIYIVTLDRDGNCSRNFKTFITSFEDSNGCEVNWCEGEAFLKQFEGKKIGGVFGRVENEYNGERKMRCELRWFCSDQKVDNAKAPNDKMLGNTTASPATPAGFTQVNTSALPW